MRGELFLILGGIASFVLAGYIVYSLNLGAEIIIPLAMAGMGGAFLGMTINYSKARELEEIISKMQERVSPRGQTLIMPWDTDIIQLYFQRSSPKFLPLTRSPPEGVEHE